MKRKLGRLVLVTLSGFQFGAAALAAVPPQVEHDKPAGISDRSKASPDAGKFQCDYIDEKGAKQNGEHTFKLPGNEVIDAIIRHEKSEDGQRTVKWLTPLSDTSGVLVTKIGSNGAAVEIQINFKGSEIESYRVTRSCGEAFGFKNVMAEARQPEDAEKIQLRALLKGDTESLEALTGRGAPPARSAPRAPAPARSAPPRQPSPPVSRPNPPVSRPNPPVVRPNPPVVTHPSNPPQVVTRPSNPRPPRQGSRPIERPTVPTTQLNPVHREETHLQPTVPANQLRTNKDGSLGETVGKEERSFVKSGDNLVLKSVKDTATGIEKHYDDSGKLTEVVHGSQVEKFSEDHSSVVSRNGVTQYGQRTFEAGNGKTIAERTYSRNGKDLVQRYSTEQKGANSLYAYTPAWQLHPQDAARYRKDYRGWDKPFHYEHPEFRNEWWKRHHDYFRFPVDYLTPSQWLAAQILADEIEYGNFLAAQQAWLQAQQDTAISQDVMGYLQNEMGDLMSHSADAGDPNVYLDQVPATANGSYYLPVAYGLAVSLADGSNQCAINPGDTIAISVPVDLTIPTLTATVISSVQGDCPAGTSITMNATDAQEFLNQMYANGNSDASQLSTLVPPPPANPLDPSLIPASKLVECHDDNRIIFYGTDALGNLYMRMLAPGLLQNQDPKAAYVEFVSPTCFGSTNGTLSGVSIKCQGGLSLNATVYDQDGNALTTGVLNGGLSRKLVTEADGQQHMTTTMNLKSADGTLQLGDGGTLDFPASACTAGTAK